MVTHLSTHPTISVDGSLSIEQKRIEDSWGASGQPVREWAQTLGHQYPWKYFITFTTDPKRGPITQDHDEYLQFVTSWLKDSVRDSLYKAHRDEYFVKEIAPKYTRPSKSGEALSHYRPISRKRFSDGVGGMYYGERVTDKEWEESRERRTFQVFRGRIHRQLKRGKIWPHHVICTERHKPKKNDTRRWWELPIHAHAVITDLKDGYTLDFETMHRLWYQTHGFIKIEEIDKRGAAGATEYTAKTLAYTVKRLKQDIDLPATVARTIPDRANPFSAYQLSKGLIDHSKSLREAIVAA